MPRSLELLAPARDLETARAAILHGADAVYVGAPRFGARASAGVPLEDLRELTAYAHLYGVRIYVALNTILYDHELEEAEALIWDLWRAGADALIVQDMGITRMKLPPIELHASTQVDTTSPEEAYLLERMGFAQVVLARELNVEQIRRIASQTSVALEVFVHGALCVSYSGRCYLSQALTKRSANRGECSQQCRLPYELVDARGQVIREDEHLLSLKDMHRGDLLEALIEAGASSFKIEGRLKSPSYVKNITAYYRQRLDAIIAQSPDRYRRASRGRERIGFVPNPYKSFNRGLTPYQLERPTMERPQPSQINPHSPKSQGERIGTLTSGKGMQWRLKTEATIVGGDGLFYIAPSGEVGGVRVNRALGSGVVALSRAETAPAGSVVYRNYDHEFERILSDHTGERRIPVRLRLFVTRWGLGLEMGLTGGESRLSVVRSLPLEIEEARNLNEERLRAELGKLGETIFQAEEVTLDFGGERPFVPLSVLGALRRETASALERALSLWGRPPRAEATLGMRSLDYSQLPRVEGKRIDYSANISNALARAHYTALGCEIEGEAYELRETVGAALMTTKHCLRHEIGYCTRETRKPMPYAEPLYLEHSGERLRLDFDCARCQMLIYRD